MSLGRFVPTPFSGSHGATGSQSIPYKGLEDIFENVRLTPDDSFIDIGCGKGRVLAYMAERQMPCRLTGIELNPDVASIARRWSSSYSNIEIRFSSPESNALCQGVVNSDKIDWLFVGLG